MSEVEELPSSKLGTKKYWDSTYDRELSKYAINGDIGEIWFGEESLDRVIAWMMESNLVDKKSFVIDVGCGNGAFLLYLAAEGFVNLFGIDYSQKAIELAQAIATEKKADIKYEQVDLITGNDEGNLWTKEYDVCHDKGTYDAVSLCPDDPRSKRLSYIKSLYQITKENGLFIITSCNWTCDELIEHFRDYFVKEHIIPTPTFMFGGKIGSQVSSVVFRKLSK